MCTYADCLRIFRGWIFRWKDGAGTFTVARYIVKRKMMFWRARFLGIKEKMCWYIAGWL